MTSALEDSFAFQLDACGLRAYVREFVAIPGRKFRWDFAFLDANPRLLVEINGGTFTRGGHSTGIGIRRDYEKNNLAQLAGWRTLSFDGDAVKSGAAVEMVRLALGGE